MLLVVCQLSGDVTGCEDCKTRLLRFDPSSVGQMSVGLLLVKISRFVYCLSVSLLSSISGLEGADSCWQRFSSVCSKLVNQHSSLVQHRVFNNVG